MADFVRRTFESVTPKIRQGFRACFLLHFTVLAVASLPIAGWGPGAWPCSALILLAGLALLHVRFCLAFLCGLALIPVMPEVLSFLDQFRDPPAEYSCGLQARSHNPRKDRDDAVWGIRTT